MEIFQVFVQLLPYNCADPFPRSDKSAAEEFDNINAKIGDIPVK